MNKASLYRSRSFGSNSGHSLKRRVERTKGPGLDDFYGNFPMYPDVVHTVDIPSGTSDRVIGVKRGAPDNPGANSCIYLVFQHAAQSASPPLGQPPTIDEATRQRLLALLDKAQTEIDAARALLEAQS